MKKVRLTQRITSRETESFKKYLEEIRDIEKFDADQEYEIALIARNAELKMIDADKIINDTQLTLEERTNARSEWRKAEKEREDALTQLITRNLRFVVSVAKQYVSSENTLEDLVNEGNYGLVQAARRYDITKGFKFITYAVWWIRRDILTYINRNARIVRLPNNKLAMLSKLKEEVNILEQVLERTPTYNEIVEFVAKGHGDLYSEEDVRFYLESETEGSFSMDKTVGNDESSSAMSDLFEDHTFGGADKLLTDKDSNYNVSVLLSKLKNDKERQVMTLLYGLDGNDPIEVKEVGVIMDVSRERIRQIRENSLKTLREYFN